MVILSSQKTSSQFTSQIAIFSHLFYDSQITYTQTDRIKTLIKQGWCMPVTKTKTFSGRVERVVHVATIDDVNLMLYGVLISGEPE